MTIKTSGQRSNNPPINLLKILDKFISIILRLLRIHKSPIKIKTTPKYTLRLLILTSSFYSSFPQTHFFVYIPNSKIKLLFSKKDS